MHSWSSVRSANLGIHRLRSDHKMRHFAAYDWRRIHSATPLRNALTCSDGCAFLSGEGSPNEDPISASQCCRPRPACARRTFPSCNGAGACVAGYGRGSAAFRGVSGASNEAFVPWPTRGTTSPLRHLHKPREFEESARSRAPFVAATVPCRTARTSSAWSASVWSA